MKVLIVLCLAAMAAADYDPWYASAPEPTRVVCPSKLGSGPCQPVVCEPNKKPCNPCVCPPKQPCQPVVCPPHGGVCQLARIYYRYSIKYPCENCASQVKEETMNPLVVKGFYNVTLPYSESSVLYSFPRAGGW